MAQAGAPRGTLFRSSGQKDRLSGQIPMSERRDPMVCPGMDALLFRMLILSLTFLHPHDSLLNYY